ncbi:S-methyl-5-thioribose-1-phosphate isomerase [Candidatus Latescibacterota bacterium]
MPVETLKWKEKGLEIIDQRFLPLEEKRSLLTTTEEVAESIETLAVRGAPAIGVAAAYGVVIAAMENTEENHVRAAINRLRLTRPTAVNLFHALDRMSAGLNDAFESQDPVKRLLECAHSIYEEDMQKCRILSQYGARLLNDGDTVLTHCNAGGLATSGYGTALGIIYSACEEGKRITVYADETRPLLQGARLTAWELSKSGVPVTVICDSMAAVVMCQGKIDHVIVGADRIAANGDTANKIGTYGLSVCAREHEVPFYVAAPLTSFDFSLASGDDIPIEERNPREIHTPFGTRIAPDNIFYYNPAFDVTPVGNISSIISEKGIAYPPFENALESWNPERSVSDL